MQAVLHDFWAQTGLPCRLEGHTHQAMETPYLLYTARSSGFGEPVEMTATAWFSGRDAAKKRAVLAEVVESMLPVQGMKIIAAGGMMVIERDSGFMEMIGDKTDPMLKGLRVRATVRMYG